LLGRELGKIARELCLGDLLPYPQLPKVLSSQLIFRFRIGERLPRGFVRL